MKETGLDTLIPGEKGIVGGFGAHTEEVRQRLMEMGLTKGTLVEVIRLAPLGDPIEISVRGYRLSLRKREAAAIVVRKEERTFFHRQRLWQRNKNTRSTRA